MQWQFEEEHIGAVVMSEEVHHSCSVNRWKNVFWGNGSKQWKGYVSEAVDNKLGGLLPCSGGE